jgi:hypothetical protein
MLTIVDDAGKVISDIHGKPAIAMITEAAEEATGAASASITIRPILPGARGGFSAIIDPVTNTLADVLTFDGGGAGIGLCSVSDPAHAADCVPVVDGIPVILPPGGILETGQPQEIASFPSSSGRGDIHVIFQSSDPIPEPSTVALLALGLGCMSVVRRPGLRSAA